MKANEFVKKFGLEAAKQKIDFLENRSFNKSESKRAMLNDLKRLVESHELVQDLYGIERARQYADSKYTAPEISVAIKQAINLVESCQ